MAVFPRLRLRDPAIDLVDLPWELPLAEWSSDRLSFRYVPVGPSRHLVRFLVSSGTLYALKDLPLDVARQEYDVLLHLENLGLPSVEVAGVAEAPARDSAILVTKFLPHSLQYRRLLMRLPPGPSSHRGRLLDAMAFLLVDLHRSGVFWGDCSLANTLFRRDGDRIQAYLVDAETGEVFPSLSDGQRAYDLEILVENVAFGLADLAAMQGWPDDGDDAIHAAEHVRERYEQIWTSIHDEPVLHPDDRQAIRNRVRKLNDLGYSVDLDLDPNATDGRVRLRMSVTTRRYHARELERRTRIRALEGQAQLLLNDLNEYGTWLEWSESRSIPGEEVAERWLHDVYRPTLARITAAVGPDRDLVQAYCDVLEEKWLMSEREGRDIGLSTAIEAYLALGAPAPESPGSDGDVTDLLDPLDAGPIELELLEPEPLEPGDDAFGPGMAPSDP
jgi:tRNA A-37 threonylcarbamoyl transferase component Bud32